MDGKEGLAVQTARGELRGSVCGEPSYPGDLASVVASGAGRIVESYNELLAAPIIDQARISFLTPILRPRKVICAGLNYRLHAEESPFPIPSHPTFFARFATSLSGHLSSLIHPQTSGQFDYEGEMAVIVGRGGRRIDRSRALEHVLGYSIFNDCTARDHAAPGTQWTLAKNFDATGAFGPAVVTADELPAGGRGLRLQTRLNGRIVQEALTSDMIFDVASLIEAISEAITLEPGDVIATGTPSGVGIARNPPLFMHAGDTCEVEIEGLGILRNTVINERPLSTE
jgi:acylpyruvate hydrolase